MNTLKQDKGLNTELFQILMAITVPTDYKFVLNWLSIS